MSEQSLTLAADQAAGLVGKLKPLPSPRMRCVVLAEYLISAAPADAVAALAALVSHATSHGDSNYLLAVESLTTTLGDPEIVPYKTRAALYEAAKNLGLMEIGRLFFSSSPSLVSASELEKQLAPERPVMPKGRALTLGERKSLARTHRRDLIQRLVQDPHPDVVRILLGNPHVTEADVVAIAARRPAAPDALTAVAADARWNTRYKVKLALAQNPYTPVHLAIRLITTMRAPDLRAIAGNSHLPEPLRAQAQALLTHR